jgi:hypothetical protein
MVSGKPLSAREKVFIESNKDILSLPDTAKQLGELYPQDNCGHRDRQSIRNHIKKISQEQDK